MIKRPMMLATRLRLAVLVVVLCFVALVMWLSHRSAASLLEVKMLTTVEQVLAVVRSSTKKIIAMKPLAMGRIAPQEGMDAGEELVLPRRLDHVVVGAIFQREDDVLLGIAHRDEEHRHLARDVGAQPARVARNQRQHHDGGDIGQSRQEISPRIHVSDRNK